MKYILPILTACLMTVSVAYGESMFKDGDIVPLSITRADGVSVPLSVEMAVSFQAGEKGLMFRTSMPKDLGMLFIFDDEATRSFWMRNTLIPLDMIFIRKDGKILNIHANAIPRDETPIYSSGPATAVLEINGGRAVELDLKAGDIINHNFFANTLAHKATMP